MNDMDTAIAFLYLCVFLRVNPFLLPAISRVWHSFLESLLWISLFIWSLLVIVESGGKGESYLIF